MWIIDNTRIFVQELNDEAQQVVARLTPIASGTVYHTFGYEELIKNVNAYIVGEVDRENIIDMTRDASTHTLSGMGITWGDFYLKQAGFTMVNISCQTLRPDLDDDAPVYIVDLEFWKDE
jgi:hypothetical protein